MYQLHLNSKKSRFAARFQNTGSRGQNQAADMRIFKIKHERINLWGGC